jgi:hypothetical protein
VSAVMLVDASNACMLPLSVFCKAACSASPLQHAPLHLLYPLAYNWTCLQGAMPEQKDIMH